MEFSGRSQGLFKAFSGPFSPRNCQAKDRIVQAGEAVCGRFAAMMAGFFRKFFLYGCNEMGEKMTLLVRPFFIGFCVWLAAWMGATAALAAGVSCEDWNTKAFFERAGVEDVSRCLKARANPNA